MCFRGVNHVSLLHFNEHQLNCLLSLAESLPMYTVLFGHSKSLLAVHIPMRKTSLRSLTSLSTKSLSGCSVNSICNLSVLMGVIVQSPRCGLSLSVIVQSVACPCHWLGHSHWSNLGIIWTFDTSLWSSTNKTHM